MSFSMENVNSNAEPTEEEIDEIKEVGLQVGTFVECKWRDDAFRMYFYFSNLCYATFNTFSLIFKGEYGPTNPYLLLKINENV
jgi:hypothetical protein